MISHQTLVGHLIPSLDPNWSMQLGDSWKPSWCMQVLVTGMILRNHTYLKVYKCWRILPILKIPTIKWLAIFFKKYFNFQGFYIVYIIIWQFLGWKFFTPSKLDETGLQKMQNGESFLGGKQGKIAHWAKIRP